MLAINNIAGLADIYGMHEGSGRVSYKRLVNGGMLDFQITGMDYASLPPGSVIGLHDHPDSPEIWVVLNGSGKVQHEDSHVTLGPDQMLFTPAGGRHAMVNPDDAKAPIEFVVVTMMSPTPRAGGLDGSVVRQLGDGPVKFPGFGTDSYSIELSHIAPGSTVSIEDSEAQTLVFLTDGAATVTWGSVVAGLTKGGTAGIPSGEHVNIRADPTSGCRMLAVCIRHEGFAPPAKTS